MDALRLPSSTSQQRHSFDSTTKASGTINVAIFGSSGVGKTTLINQFINGNLNQNYQPTIEDCHHVSFKVGDNDCRIVQFIDTAGLYEFPAMRRFNVTSADAFIAVFSPLQLHTLHYCFNIIQEVYEFRGKDDVQIALIGNHRSGDDSGSALGEAKQTYKLSGNLVYYFISALDKPAIDKLVNDLINAVVVAKMNKTKNEASTSSPKLTLRKRSAQATSTTNVGPAIQMTSKSHAEMEFKKAANHKKLICNLM